MKDTIKKDLLKVAPDQVFWPAKHNRVQIYDLHQVLLLDVSCDQCINKEHCSETKKDTYCEIDDVITESGDFDIQVQVQGTTNSKYFVYTDDYESLNTANSAVAKIKKQFAC